MQPCGRIRHGFVGDAYRSITGRDQHRGSPMLAHLWKVVVYIVTTLGVISRQRGLLFRERVPLQARPSAPSKKRGCRARDPETGS
jgi:hypothetical protein